MPRWAVMLTVRDGTLQLVNNVGGMGWQFRYTTITWVVEEDPAVAEQVRKDLLAGDPARRNILQAYLEQQ